MSDKDELRAAKEAEAARGTRSWKVRMRLVESGIWCPTCLLPSGIHQTWEFLAEDGTGPTTSAEFVFCLDGKHWIGERPKLPLFPEDDA